MMKITGVFLENLLFVSSTFLALFVTNGIAFSIGVFLVPFMEEFNQSSKMTSLVGSVNIAAMCLIGPLASFLYTKYGYLNPLLSGGALSVVGLLAAAYSPDIISLIVCFGVVAGTGFGFVFISSIYIVNLNIKTHRTLYTCVAMCGIGLGTTVQANLCSLLISIYGWRGTMLIQAGLNMHIFLAAGLIWMAFRMKRRRKIRERISRLSIISINGLQLPVLNIKTGDNDDHQLGSSRWKNSFFYMLLLNSLLCWFGYSVAYIHLPAFIKSKSEFSDEVISSLIGSLGLFGLIGRIVFGTITSHPKVNLKLLYQTSHFISGIAMFLVTLCTNYFYLLLCIGLLGFTQAGSFAIQPEIVVRKLGMSQFSSAYADVSVVAGLGMLFGAPCAGIIYDKLKLYQFSLYLGAVALVLSALVMAVTKCCKQNKTIQFSEVYVKNVLPSKKVVDETKESNSVAKFVKKWGEMDKQFNSV